MAPAPHNEETVCSDGTSWAGARLLYGHMTSRKEVAQSCMSNKCLQRKDDCKPGPQQSPPEVDFSSILQKGFVGAWMNWVHQTLPVLILPCS